jgi:hypothetical protein
MGRSGLVFPSAAFIICINPNRDDLLLFSPWLTSAFAGRLIHFEA